MSSSVSFSPHYIGSSFSTEGDADADRDEIDVSVPIISGLLFQLNDQVLPRCIVSSFSPHYIGSSFSTQKDEETSIVVFSFQSPLYRVFFFNQFLTKIGMKKHTVSVPIISGLLFQPYLGFFGSPGTGEVSVPIISGLLFQPLRKRPTLRLFLRFSPHYIGSSFSTDADKLNAETEIFCFSPHYIGSSFSTVLVARVSGHVDSSFSPHYIGSSFSTKAV